MFDIFKNISLEEQLTMALFSVQAEKEDIELVFKNGIFFYVYKNDWYYNSIKEQDRDFNLLSYERRLHLIDKSESSFLEKYPINTAELLLLDIAQNAEKSLYLDVGTNYGQWVVRAKKILQINNVEMETIAFEPGYSSRLAVFNLAFHDFYDVKFLPVSISNKQTIIPFFAMTGHSEDNKFVNRPVNSISFPSFSITLEDILSTYDFSTEFFIKIDTQGAELEVIDGLGSLINSNIVSIMEFSPKSISSRKKPIDFLYFINQYFYIAELDPYQQYVDIVLPLQFDTFINKIWIRKSPFCDVILISKKHPRAEYLLNLLVSNKGVSQGNWTE